jgi:hypothetical protein
VEADADHGAISAELERAGDPPRLTASAVVNLLSHSKPSLVKEGIARLMAEGFVTEAKSGRSKVLKPRPALQRRGRRRPAARPTRRPLNRTSSSASTPTDRPEIRASERESNE